MRELLSRAAEDLCEPLDSLLMRHIREGAVAEEIRQAVGACVHPRHLLRRPKVPPPRHIRQRKENREDNCHKNCYQSSSLQTRDIQAPWRLGNDRCFSLQWLN